MEEILLKEHNMAAFSHLIPELLQRELRMQRLVGVGLWDPEWEAPMAVLLLRATNGWMELVWLAVDQDYRGLALPRYLMRRALARARRARRLWGAIADLPDGEYHGYFRRLLEQMDFDFTEIDSRVYTAPLEEILRNEDLRSLRHGGNVTALRNAAPALLQNLLDAIHTDSRPVPLPAKPDWSAYDGALSGIFLSGGTPRGLLLLERDGKELTMACAWASSVSALPQLLAFSMEQAGAQYPPDTQVVIPAISEASQKLVQRLLPQVRPQTVLQARRLFVNAEEVSW